MENKVLVLNLHTQACEIASRYQKIEIELVDILQRIDFHRVYLKYGCGSLFEYAVSQLRLSESAAYNFIAVSRKALEVPALKEAIKSQSLSVSKARRITSVITKDNQEKWIPLALELSQRDLEKEVANVNPQVEKPERAKFVKEDRVNLNFHVSEDLYNKIKRIQDLEAQRTSKVVSLEDALKAMAELYLEKKDPVEKATRAVAKPDSCRVKAAAPRSGRYRSIPADSCRVEKAQKPSIPFVRQNIPAHLKHQVHLRDKGRCSYTAPNGKVCTNSRWIQIHHIIPISHGGMNRLENLKTLCSAHHRMMHTHSK